MSCDARVERVVPHLAGHLPVVVYVPMSWRLPVDGVVQEGPHGLRTVVVL